MPKSPEQNFFDDSSKAILEAELALRHRDWKNLDEIIKNLKEERGEGLDVDAIKRIDYLITELDKVRDGIIQELQEFQVKLGGVELELNSKCAECGAPVGETVGFCGECGTENPGFNAEEFKKDMGVSLEEVKKQEGCATGHPSAVEDKDLLSDYCIYCGKKY